MLRISFFFIIKSLKLGNFPLNNDKFCLVFIPGIFNIFIFIFNLPNLFISSSPNNQNINKLKFSRFGDNYECNKLNSNDKKNLC